MAPSIGQLKRIQFDARADLIARIKKAQVGIGQKIADAAASGKILNKTFQDKFYGKIKTHYGLLDAELDAWGKELAGDVAVDFHKAAVKDIAAFGEAITAPVLKFDRSRVQTYFEMIRPDNASSIAATFTSKMAAADIGGLRTAVVDVYRQRGLEGWTQARAHKELQDRWDTLAGNLAGDRFVDAAGRRWSNAAYLSMLTRTTTARVARDSYFDTLLANGDDLARIGPSGDSCPNCLRWMGLIISISGTNKKFPSYSDAQAGGVFHPNCDCLASRIDETVDGLDIERQSGTPNPNWTDPDAVDAYKADFLKTPAPNATATLDSIRQLVNNAKGAAGAAAAGPQAVAAQAALAKLQAEEMAAKAAARSLQHTATKAKKAQEAQAAALESQRLAAEAEAARIASEAQRQAATLAAEDLDSVGFQGAKDFGKLLKSTGQAAGGTQGSIIYADPTGQKWIIKTYGGNTDRVRTEWVANRLLSQLTLKVPPGRLAVLDDGSLAYASRLADGFQEMGAKNVDWAAKQLAIRRGFVGDAWLANWDTAGQNFDNVIVQPGKASGILRIDHGGALKWRAMGERKAESAFGEVVAELKTLRDGTNPQTARLFAGVTDEDVSTAIASLQKTMSRAQLRGILQASGWSEAEIVSHERILWARRNYLADWRRKFMDKGAKASVAGEEAISAAAPFSAEAPITHDEVAAVARSRANGVTIRMGGEDLEDHSALLWHEVDNVGRPVTGVAVRFRGPALERLNLAVGKALEKLGASVTPSVAGVVVDHGAVFDKLTQAVKAIRHKAQSGTAIGLNDWTRVKEAREAYDKAGIQILNGIKSGNLTPKSLDEFQAKFMPYMHAAEASIKPGVGAPAKWNGPDAFVQSWKGPKAAKAAKAPAAAKTNKADGELNFVPSTDHFVKTTTNGRIVATKQKLSAARWEASKVPFLKAELDDGTVIKVFPDTKDVPIASYGYADKGEGFFAFRGRVEIMVPGQDTAAANSARAVLSKLGANIRRMTDAETEALYLRKIAYKLADENTFGEYSAMMKAADKFTAANQQVAFLRAEVSKFAGVPDIVMRPGYAPRGRAVFGEGQTFQELPSLGPKWDDFFAEHRIFHESSMEAEDLLDVVLSSGGNMVSTTEKVRRGIPPVGMSPDDDTATGGASFVFCRLRTAADARRESGLVWKAERAKRLDAFSWDRDRYGNTIGGEKALSSMRRTSVDAMRVAVSNSSNETCFKSSLSLFDELDSIRVRTLVQHQKCIAVLKKHGWNPKDLWPGGGGRTVENMIKVGGEK